MTAGILGLAVAVLSSVGGGATDLSGQTSQTLTYMIPRDFTFYKGNISGPGATSAENYASFVAAIESDAPEGYQFTELLTEEGGFPIFVAVDDAGQWGTAISINHTVFEDFNSALQVYTTRPAQTYYLDNT